MIKFVVYLRKRKMKMKLNIFALLLASALLSGFAADAQVSGTVGLDRSHSKEFREALRLHDYGMYSRSRQSFDELSRKTGATISAMKSTITRISTSRLSRCVR